MTSRQRNQPPTRNGFSKTYWLYVTAGALIAAGHADFSLVAFHFQRTATVSQDLTPVCYALATAMGAMASLVVGRLLDKLGIPVVILAVGLTALFAPLAFLGGRSLALDKSILGVVSFLLVLQVLALPVLSLARKQQGPA